MCLYLFFFFTCMKYECVLCCWLQAQYFICGCAIFIQNFWVISFICRKTCLDSVLCLYSCQWHGFFFFPLLLWIPFPKCRLSLSMFLLSLVSLSFFFFFVAKPSHLPKSHPVSPVVGSSVWLQSSPPPALGSSPTPTWRERKVWHGLQPLMQEHFILGFI